MQVNSKANTHTKKDCATCLGVHNDAIHEATLRVRVWHRDQLAYRTMTVELRDPPPVMTLRLTNTELIGCSEQP